MENKPNPNKKSELELYSEQGLSRLSKEKLVTIISNLQNMPVELAMKLSEHIPEVLGMCKEALANVNSMYLGSKETSQNYAQKEFEGFDSRRDLLENGFKEAKTPEDRKFYLDELKKLDKEVEDLRAKLEKDQDKRVKAFLKVILPILGLAGGTIGLTIGIGKRR